MTVSEGSRLGPYEIVSPLGAGGMGEVWKARDTRLDRSVAIKILSAEFSRDASLKLRFEREAKTISQLNHPHICTLYDVGDDYLVMELLEGESLADRLIKGALPLDQVLRYGAQIAEALDKAHKAGVVHRDLKPGNIMLTKSGAKLLDFGLAKPAAVFEAAGEATQHKPLTQEGTIVGTFQYMAPEQIEAGAVDARTDIFALGAVLYEMATGRRAFEGKSKASLIASILTADPPPITALQPMTPASLDRVIRACLQKEPDERWQSARDVATELRWIGNEEPAAGVAARAVSRTTAILCLLALVIVAAASWIGGRATRAKVREAIRFSIPTVGPGFRNASTVAVAPDGRSLAFTARDERGFSSIWLRRFDDFSPRKLNGSDGLSVGSFAGDGKSLIAFGANKVVRFPLDGGTPQAIADIAPARGTQPKITDDGTLILEGNDGRILKYAAGRATPITALDRSRFEIAHTQPEILPDQKQFLFISYRRDPNATRFIGVDLYIGSVDGGPARRVGEIPSQVKYAAGQLFFVRDGTLVAAPFDLKTFRLGDSQAIADGVDTYKQSGGAAFYVSRDGKVIVYQPFSGQASLAWFDLRGQRMATVAEGVDINAFAIAPDQRVVYTSERRPPDGIRHLWSRSLTRDAANPLSFEWSYEQNPVVTRDGKILFYDSDRLDYPDVYRKRLDKSGAGELVVRAPSYQGPSDVSPDGRYLLYLTRQDAAATRTDLWVKPLFGDGKPFPFVRTPSDDNFGSFSPDGTEVAYVSTITGIREVYVTSFPAPGQPRQISSGGGTIPRWSADGKSLYFYRPGKMLVADPTKPDTEPRTLFDIDDVVRDFDIAKDGKRLLIATSKQEQISPPLNVIAGWSPK